ncbi:MAG: phosphonate dehydrogenase [Methyloligellaceae bacterium]
MMRPKVVVTGPIFDEVAEYLTRHCELVANTGVDPWPRDELLARLDSARAMLAFMHDSVDADFLSRSAGSLGIIACALKGCDNFDVDACTRHGVWLTVVPDLLTEPTAELAVGLLIALARNIRPGDHIVRSVGFEGWRPILYGKGLRQSTVGIVGAGKVGRTLAHYLQGFGCRLVYFDAAALPEAKERRLGMIRMPLEDILKTSDFVVMCLSLDDTTFHMLNEERLKLMKPGAYLINVSRGSTVDEGAVADALECGQLAGYAADVFELEDWAQPQRPRAVDPRLLAPDAPTLFTPHLGSAVMGVRLEIEMRAARSIVQFLEGKVPDGAVNQLEMTNRRSAEEPKGKP